MTNLYHIMDKVPAYTPEEILVEYEQLAQSLVKSGRIRIDTDDKSNFARFSDPHHNINLMFSKEELTDPVLIDRTRALLIQHYGKPTEANHKKANDIIKSLRSQITKLQPISTDLVLKLARIFVQAVHPIVIKWLLMEGVEVFISYSHNIGDMMDIQSWRQAGTNSGMQSTDGRNAAIFVSCGGDPFGETSKDHPTYGDGFPSMARMQVIAGQEIGHYSDILRDSRGRQIGRHSANFACTRATPHVLQARRQDLKKCDSIAKILYENGMKELIKYEEIVRFYRKNKVGGFRLWYNALVALVYKQKLLIAVHSRNMAFVKRFANDEYMGLMLRAMIADMKFNLEPVADVYKRDDKEAEEAIACVEALARVPQQVVKWGFLTTRAMMAGLYHVYYGEVIPSLIECYGLVTGKPYHRSYEYMKQSMGYKIKKFFKRLRGNELKPSREVP
jgi:hypothetical protein